MESNVSTVRATKKLISSQDFRALVAGVCVMILVVEGNFCEASGPPSACSGSATSLSVCLPAVQGDNPPFPTDACCAVVRGTDTGCLCNIVTEYSSAISYMGVNVSAALLLPKNCKHVLPVGYNCDGYIFSSYVPPHRKLMNV